MHTIATSTTPDEFLVMQDLVRLHLPYQQTGGDFFVMEVEVAPGGGVPPLHTHPAAEFFYTLEGELSFFRLDGDELLEFSGGPGTNAFIPSGVPHTYRNFSGRPARYLATLSPPVEMQDFLVEAGIRAGEPALTPEEVLASPFITQPALSQQIRVLEEQVGLPLFVRHPRGLDLTEAGEVLLQEAREVLGRAERLEAAVDELRSGRTRSLRIGVPPGLPRSLLPALLARLREREPDARVELRELTTPAQLAALRADELDLGLVREPVQDERLARRTLLVEPLGVSLPAGHPLAGRESLSLEELRDELFVCFPRAWAPALHDVLVEELRARDVQARFQDSAHLSTTESMVAAGLGITLSAPPWLEGVEGVVWRPMAGTQIEIRTAAAWRRSDRSPLLRALVELLPAASDAPARPAAPAPAPDGGT